MPMHRFSYDYKKYSKKFQLPSLYSMLVINDVKTMIKICNGKIDCKKILDALPFDTRNLNLRENLPFYLDFDNRRYLDNAHINVIVQVG